VSRAGVGGLFRKLREPVRRALFATGVILAGFAAMFRAELRDGSRHPLTWLGLVATVAAAWVFASQESLRPNGYVVYEAALQAASRTAAFFLLAGAAVTVAGDRTRGTVRWILPRPVARGGYVLGKAAAHAVLALAVLVAAVGTSWASAAPLGFGDVVAGVEGDEDDEVFNFVEEELVHPEFRAGRMHTRTLAATALVLPALLTATGLGLLVSCLMRSSSAAVILSLGVAIPLSYLPEVFNLAPRTAHVLPFRAASDYLTRVRHFGRNLATAEWPTEHTLALAGVVGAVVVLPLAAVLVFRHADITD